MADAQALTRQREGERPSSAELEVVLRSMGAQIIRPVASDPVATLDGRTVAVWVGFSREER